MEKEMATHSSIFAWRIPWTEEPGGLQSRVLQSQKWLSNKMHTASTNRIQTQSKGTYPSPADQEYLFWEHTV